MHSALLAQCIGASGIQYASDFSACITEALSATGRAKTAIAEGTPPLQGEGEGYLRTDSMQASASSCGKIRPGIAKRATAHLFHDTGNIVHIHNQVVVLGDLAGDLNNGGLLESICADHAPWHLQSSHHCISSQTMLKPV